MKAGLTMELKKMHGMSYVDGSASSLPARWRRKTMVVAFSCTSYLGTNSCGGLSLSMASIRFDTISRVHIVVVTRNAWDEP